VTAFNTITSRKWVSLKKGMFEFNWSVF